MAHASIALSGRIVIEIERLAGEHQTAAEGARRVVGLRKQPLSELLVLPPVFGGGHQNTVGRTIIGLAQSNVTAS
jgi:hypothetical protein